MIYCIYIMTLETAKMHSWGNGVVLFAVLMFLMYYLKSEPLPLFASVTWDCKEW